MSQIPLILEGQPTFQYVKRTHAPTRKSLDFGPQKVQFTGFHNQSTL